jgi:uncharacterized protein YukJ
MRLPNYGVLSGRLVAHSPQPGGNPHYQLFIEADGIRYRAAVNLESTVSTTDVFPELQYQVIPDLRASGSPGARDLLAHLSNQGSFLLADSSANPPTLDFVHGNVIDMAAFQTLPRGTNPKHNDFYQRLVAAAEKARQSATAFVVVFGTGFPSHGPTAHSAAGFTGVDNIHMNQGNFRLIDGEPNRFFQENAPNQDGAVLFFHDDGTVQGFFSKFQSQDNETDAHGNPVHTGVAELDAIPAAVRARVAPAAPFAHLLDTAHARRRRHAPRGPSAPAGAGAAAGGFVFADSVPDTDPNLPFQPDNDEDVRNSPFVQQFAKYGVPEPVPGPRGGRYPTMKLADVLGPAAVQAITASGQLVFHAVGDTGCPTVAVEPHTEEVAALMVADFNAPARERPAFYFHLGDVVYYYGEEKFYYEQFYRPYKNYPAPIFAIPGNHDGIIYNEDMVSLAAFEKAFCDDAPRHWEAAAGIARTTMTQPGVYFTLDAPFVSIVGLYSNCSEYYGYLDQQQKLFLYSELKRLKPLRDSGAIAAIVVAVHHPPLSFNPAKPSSARMRNDMDAACGEAKCWPDAVLSGHAHVYQRMTRTVPIDSETWQIPYLVAGSGGQYNPRQEIDKAGVKLLDQQDASFKLHHFLPNYGYLRVTVRPARGAQNPTLRIEFHSPDLNAGHPSADACVLDLKTHQYVI